MKYNVLSSNLDFSDAFKDIRESAEFFATLKKISKDHPNGVSFTPNDISFNNETVNKVSDKKYSLTFIEKHYLKGMRLPSWKEDVVILVQVPDEHSKMSHPYLYVTSRFGACPWKETYVELFSKEWDLVEIIEE